jgi:hypothetical protein
MCTVLLPRGVNPVTVKYISYQFPGTEIFGSKYSFINKGVLTVDGTQSFVSVFSTQPDSGQRFK